MNCECKSPRWDFVCVKGPHLNISDGFVSASKANGGNGDNPGGWAFHLASVFDDIRRNLIEINETKFPKKRWRQQVINRLDLRLFDSLTR